MKLLLFFIFPTLLFSQEKIARVPQWSTHEIRLTSAETYKNPYTDEARFLGAYLWPTSKDDGTSPMENHFWPRTANSMFPI